jgi:hypothetical protein
MGWTGFEWSVLSAAVGIGALHTVLGPDHYVPFVMIGRARGWSRARAAWVAAACGTAHVLSSLLLGWAGILLGWTVGRLEGVESGRGSLAAWALVAFGLAYGAWGARKAVRRSRGIEPHAHDGQVHIHAHGRRTHAHGGGAFSRSTSFWTLFLVFVLGPCEPLVPLFMLPASRGQWGLAGLAALVFGVVTVALMATLAYAGIAGLSRLGLGAWERWSHAMAGAVVALTGLAVIVLGL